MPPRPYDRHHEGGTEFEGLHGPAGVSPKGPEALTASEKLRLGYATGTADPLAPIDPHAWEGTDRVKWDGLDQLYLPPTQEQALAMPPGSWINLAESFNGPDGPVGPDLNWTREPIFDDHANSMRVENQRLVQSAAVAGGFEDIQAPDPTVYTDMSMSLDIVGVEKVDLTQEYVCDVGAIFRYNRVSDTAYRGYAFGYGRSNIWFGPTIHFWHLLVFRLDVIGGVHQPTLLRNSLAFLANNALPAKLSASMHGPFITVEVTHQGSGAAHKLTARDDTYGWGSFVLGSSIVQSSGTARWEADNLVFSGKPE